MEVVHCGRVVTIGDPLQIGRVHLFREAGRVSPVAQLGVLRRAVGSCDDMHVALANDWGFVDSTEGRWCVRTGTPNYVQDSVVGAFDRMFPEFAEVRQPAYTRRQLRYQDGAPEVDTVSRLDRMLANSSTPLLVARQFASWARGAVYDRDIPSDHVTISLRWLSVRRTRRHVVPQWVAYHPAYPELVAEISPEVELELADDPFA